MFPFFSQYRCGVVALSHLWPAVLDDYVSLASIIKVQRELYNMFLHIFCQNVKSSDEFLLYFL